MFQERLQLKPRLPSSSPELRSTTADKSMYKRKNERKRQCLNPMLTWIGQLHHGTTGSSIDSANAKVHSEGLQHLQSLPGCVPAPGLAVCQVYLSLHALVLCER